MKNRFFAHREIVLMIEKIRAVVPEIEVQHHGIGSPDRQHEVKERAILPETDPGDPGVQQVEVPAAPRESSFSIRVWAASG